MVAAGRPATISLFMLMVLMLACSYVPTVHAQASSQPGGLVPEPVFPDVRYWNDPAQGAAGSPAAAQVPKRDMPKIIILMYHNLVFGRTGNEYNRDIYNFEQDLKFLARNFSVIDFDDLVAIRDGRLELSSDAAIITFDDGDLSMYALAFPLLREYGMKASFFIITDFVGTTGYMNWNQIKELARYRTNAGVPLFSIGSHSASHPHLATVDSAAILQELQVSKSVLESHIGKTVEFLALPFGSGAGKPEIIEAARASGYKAIRTSRMDIVTPDTLDLWQLPGISINNEGSDKVSANIWSLLGY